MANRAVGMGIIEIGGKEYIVADIVKHKNETLPPDHPGKLVYSLVDTKTGDPEVMIHHRPYNRW